MAIFVAKEVVKSLQKFDSPVNSLNRLILCIKSDIIKMGMIPDGEFVTQKSVKEGDLVIVYGHRENWESLVSESRSLVPPKKRRVLSIKRENNYIAIKFGVFLGDTVSDSDHQIFESNPEYFFRVSPSFKTPRIIRV